MRRGLILVSILIFMGLSLALADESIVITTYYPSPYGNYNELRANKMSVGSAYNNFSSFPLTDGNLIVSGKVGIGTANPSARLEVAGNVKIVDGTQGAGKVLTSDAGGLASWKSTTSSCPCGTCWAANMAGNGSYSNCGCICTPAGWSCIAPCGSYY
jgi:hypothetical protein